MTTKRTERLFLLVNLLRSGRGYTAPELAELLGVSPRTIYRDVVDLSSVVSVYYDGGYRLLTEEYVANLSFTRDELLALKLAVQLPPLAQASHLVAAARSALAKVDEQLDRRFGGDAGFERNFSVHVAAHPLNPRMVRILRTLEDAVRTRRRVTITYYTLSRDATAARAVDPYGLSFRRHSWYLVGYCRLRGEVRVFRLDRISRVKLTEDRFDRPEGFGVEKFFADAWEVYASAAKARVQLRFRPQIRAVVEPILGERGRFRDGEGGMVFEGEVPLSDEFCRWLLSCGDEVEVLAPAALRAALGRRVAAAAAYYDEPGGRGKAAKP